MNSRIAPRKLTRLPKPGRRPRPKAAGQRGVSTRHCRARATRTYVPPSQSVKTQAEGHVAHPLRERGSTWGHHCVGEDSRAQASRLLAAGPENLLLLSHRPANVATWFSSLSEIKTHQELEEVLLQKKTQKSESTTTAMWAM